jgi:hypothetical protein
MTEPVAGVAMMQLWEKGLRKLDDPIERHIPEFAGLKVKAPDESLVPQTSPMTMVQLMSHTAGFDVIAGYAQAGLRAGELKEMIRRLAALPLAAWSGTGFGLDFAVIEDPAAAGSPPVRELSIRRLARGDDWRLGETVPLTVAGRPEPAPYARIFSDVPEGVANSPNPS